MTSSSSYDILSFLNYRLGAVMLSSNYKNANITLTRKECVSNKKALSISENNHTLLNYHLNGEVGAEFFFPKITIIIMLIAVK